MAGIHSESLMLGKLPLALYGATFQLLEGTLVSYTPPKLFTCCQRHMHAPQPRPRRLPWSSSPSPPAFGSRPSAASSGRSFFGPELAPRPARLQISSPAAQDAWGKGVDQQHSPASFCLKRLSRAIEEGGPAKSSGAAQLRRAAELVAGGVRVAGGRVAADALRARAGGLPGEGLAGGRGGSAEGRRSARA